MIENSSARETGRSTLENRFSRNLRAPFCPDIGGKTSSAETAHMAGP
ncbi:MAG: hypothetical protein MI923_27585 [Phycisphaerales bacterium]|nr:hypothetical protein [Phycisphaerales bacterium]